MLFRSLREVVPSDTLPAVLLPCPVVVLYVPLSLTPYEWRPLCLGTLNDVISPPAQPFEPRPPNTLEISDYPKTSGTTKNNRNSRPRPLLRAPLYSLLRPYTRLSKRGGLGVRHAQVVQVAIRDHGLETPCSTPSQRCQAHHQHRKDEHTTNYTTRGQAWSEG